MNDVTKIVLSMSLSGSIISLLMLSIGFYLRAKISQTWHYYIWLIVIFRLLVPFTLKISIFSQFCEQSEDNITIQQYYIMIIWIFVAIALFTKKVISYHCFVRFIKSGQKEVVDSKVIELYKETCQKININKMPKLYCSRFVKSPMLIGLIKPFIVLPEAQLDITGLHYVLLHELSHHKRKDYIYKWLIQIAICVHFYNPIIHCIGKYINRVCEFSCDEMVIKRLDHQGKKAYGFALINALEFGTGYNHQAVSIMLCEDGRLIKSRLDAIKKYKKSSIYTILLVLIITIVLFCGAIITGGAYVFYG